MNRITMVLTGDLRIPVNHASKLSELIEGLFKDATVPMLMEIPWLFRGSPISTRDRGERKLPVISLMTFDSDMRRVQVLKEIPRGSSFKPSVREKFILEVPMNLDLPFDAIFSTEKLRFFT